MRQSHVLGHLAKRTASKRAPSCVKRANRFVAVSYRLFSRKMTFNWPRPDGPRGHQHAFVRLSVPKT